MGLKKCLFFKQNIVLLRTASQRPPKCCRPFTSPARRSALLPHAHSPLLSSPHLSPAGAAKPGKDCSAGAREGALAPWGPAGKGALGEGEPAHCRPGSAACRDSGGIFKLSDSCGRHARTEPGGGRESCREGVDTVHEPRKSFSGLLCLLFLTKRNKRSCTDVVIWFCGCGVLVLFE